MSERRCYRFTYLFNESHRDREPHISQLRDGDAALFITNILTEMGYPYAGPIINYPAPPGVVSVPFDDSFLTEDDLILLTTRPPMDDDESSCRKTIRRSRTTLEEKIFTNPLRKWLKLSTRPGLILSEAAAGVSEEIARRKTMRFRQNYDASYQSYGSAKGWQRFKGRTPYTAAFLVYTRNAWPGGPAFLAAFGMGAIETLGWCYHLANNLQDLLCTTPFAMVEMETTPVEEHPSSLSFADSWKFTVLGTAPPEAKSPPRAA